jgi:mono/diheme cytochrome c family protein
MKRIPSLAIAVILLFWSTNLRPADLKPPSSPALLQLGKQIYAQQCIACHGPQGKGDGEAAYLLYPKPRDFTAANYRLVSTWDRVPTDEDLFNTITRGMPGSAMPSWGHLPAEQRWALLYYVKSLSQKPLEVKAAKDPQPDGSGGEGFIKVPAEPPYDAAAKARALELFAEACASCHGATARGDGTQDQTDDEGFPTRPRDLTAGVFKGSPDPAQIYRRIIAGIPGTPMPMSDWAWGDDAWHLVHYVRSLSSETQRARVEMKKFEIIATRVKELPDHPDDGLWRTTPPINLHLMPLWWRSDRPEEVTVRALHDGKEISLLLVWRDDTDDHTAMRPQEFRDAAAIEFSPAPNPPFFGMGEKGRPINIWMWKSERQADLEPAFQELEKVYPNLGIDSYPNLLKAPVEQPLRHALTLESNKTFVTGWGAGNIVSDPERKSPAEDLTAQGFGTLRARPRIDQKIDARGFYGADSYRVMFKRTMKPTGTDAVALLPGTTVPVAFAVWNGSAGDRDGKKSVTIWQSLKIAK